MGAKNESKRLVTALGPRPAALGRCVDLPDGAGERQHDGAELAVADGAAEHAGALLEQQVALLRGDEQLLDHRRCEQRFGLLAAAGQLAGEQGEHAAIQPAGQRVFQPSCNRVLNGFKRRA